MEADQAEHQVFKKACHAKRQSLNGARRKKHEDEQAAAKALAKGNGKGKGKGAARGRGRGVVADPTYEETVFANIQKYMPLGAEIVQSDLAAISPPGTSVWNNWKGASWCGHCPPYSRFKCNWSDGGHTASGYDCVRCLWEQYYKLHGGGTSQCPVVGLFEPKKPEEET